MKMEKLMQCGHFWLQKRGLKTRGMCLDCYKKYLLRLKNYSDRDFRMNAVRANVMFASNSNSDEMRLLAFFDSVMPEIPIHKANKLTREILKSKLP